jgi:hypothetical protein
MEVDPRAGGRKERNGLSRRWRVGSGPPRRRGGNGGGGGGSLCKVELNETAQENLDNEEKMGNATLE